MENETTTTQNETTTTYDLITLRMLIRSTQRNLDATHKEIYASGIAELKFERLIRLMENLQAQHIQITGLPY